MKVGKEKNEEERKRRRRRIGGGKYASPPQENSVILFAQLSENSCSLNSPTCEYMVHSDYHSPSLPPSLTGCMVPPAITTALASSTTVVKWTDGLSRRYFNLD